MVTIPTAIQRTICFVLLVASLAGFSRGQDSQGITELESVEERVRTVYEQVSPAIVRFAYGNGRKLQLGSGVIVTREGHIAISGPVHAVIQNDFLDLRLVDGRRVAGKALGWSSEFGFGLLKITQKGPWPHVDLRERGDVKAGDFCVALGYPRQSIADPTQLRPMLRLGLITQSAAPFWLTSSYRFKAGAHSVFDLDMAGL